MALSHVIDSQLGLILIVLAQFFNSVMFMATKLLETDNYDEAQIHPLQILFVRMGITSIGCLAYMHLYKREPEVWGPKELRPMLVFRGVLGFITVFCTYYGLLHLSISESTVITFLEPSIAGFLAWAILNEHWSLAEALGGAASMVGVVLIARPSFLFGADLDQTVGDPHRLVATLFALVGVVCASSVYIIIRFVGRRVHALVLVNYFASSTVVLSFIGLLVIPGIGFKGPEGAKQWGLFTALGICGFLMQFLLTEGLQREAAGRATMMLYSQLLFSLIWEVVVWHQLPTLLSWMGIVIILGSAFAVIMNKPTHTSMIDLEQQDVMLEDANESKRTTIVT